MADISALAGFVRARVVDDVKWARSRRDEDFRKHRVSTRRAHLNPDDAERVLAQSAAYRRIVEECERQEQGPASALARLTLCALASMWADHPDFHEEWRS